MRPIKARYLGRARTDPVEYVFAARRRWPRIAPKTIWLAVYLGSLLGFWLCVFFRLDLFFGWLMALPNVVSALYLWPRLK